MDVLDVQEGFVIVEGGGQESGSVHSIIVLLRN